MPIAAPRRSVRDAGLTMTQYSVLGPLEVSEGGRVVEVAGGRLRALLAVLLLHANRVVSVDSIVDSLWGDEPPETAAKAVQVLVSQLRKALGRERVVTRAPGYVLRVGEGELDVDRFQGLVEAGRFSEALGLWRGPPLAEFAELSFAPAEIARLEELYAACLEERIERDLDQGRHGELVGELERLVRIHPLRERLRGQLMLALYRSGRQAEALNAYQEARNALVDELGVEPGRPLRELHQRILNQAPQLEWVQPEMLPVERVPVSEQASDPPPRVPRELRKTVTVLCASISTVAAGSVDPEALRRVLARVLFAVRSPVERHGGSVESSVGGSVTAIFGVPVVHEDDARRALRAAAEVAVQLQGTVTELGAVQGAGLQYGIGISTGEVVVGGGLAPTGQPLASAQRLAELATPNDILFDAGTWRLAREVDAEPHAGAFRLLEPTGVTTVSRAYRSPMVGRLRERRRLHDAFSQAVGDSSVQLFTVLGSAGVGKSRLVEEFLDEAAGAPVVARGRCLPYGEGITYWPLLEVVKDLASLEDSDSPDEAIAKIEGVLDEDDGGQVAVRVAEIVGLAESALGVAEGFEAVQTFVESLARRRPLIVVFDDIHWGEARFLDLVEHLAAWAREVPLLLVCLARPELLDVRPGWAGGKLNATTILLEPLSEAESAQLIDNLDGTELAERVRRRIVTAAEGNPLFVEEMLALVGEGDQGEEELDVPPTIQALLGARLDRLEDEERAVVEPAAVVGKVFYAGAVAELVSASTRDNVTAALGALIRKELIRPDRPSLGERTYRFRHILIRDAAYDSIPKQTRATMHERFGRWLEQRVGERASEYEEVVGYHLEQACRYRRELGAVEEADSTLAREAAERLGRAARRAFVRSDGPAGVNLVSRATALLPAEDPLRVDLVPNVRAIQGLGDMSWADRVLTEGLEAAATTGDRRLAAHALVQRGFLRLFTHGDVTADGLLADAERAIAVFEDARDELGLARGWRLKAQAHYLARCGGECAAASERALPHAKRSGDLFEQREIVEWLAIALFLGPTPAAEAEERCLRALAQAGGDAVQEAHLLGALAYLVAMQDRLDEASALIARTRDIVEQLGEWIWIVSWHAAAVARWLGHSTEQEVRAAYEALKAVGEKSHFSAMAQGLALALYMRGEYGEAEQAIRECREAARPNDVYSQIMSRSILAKVLARQGKLEEACTLAVEAVEFASTSDFHLGRADALVDLSEVLELAGDEFGARSALEESVEFYELKGNVLAAERSRTLAAAKVV